jgi:ATP-binding cassette subfamily B protein
MSGRHAGTNEGSIFFDDVEQRKLRYRDLRRHIGFVLQETICSTTPSPKTSRGAKRSRTLDVLCWAAKVANAMNSSNGCRSDTKLASANPALRCQADYARLAIARAVYHKPPILIFDEATSALDTESEKAVKENLDQLFAGRTSFVIAHRFKHHPRRRCDLVIEKGKIVEQGSHDDLMQRQGLYYYLTASSLGCRSQKTKRQISKGKSAGGALPF